MSVIIKNREMPKGCIECWNRFSCKHFDISFIRLNTRHPDCPLVEVPTPHGRLIDYDWVVENVIKKLGIKDKQYLLQAEKALMILVDEAPTVIEAEGME